MSLEGEILLILRGMTMTTLLLFLHIRIGRGKHFEMTMILFGDLRLICSILCTQIYDLQWWHKGVTLAIIPSSNRTSDYVRLRLVIIIIVIMTTSCVWLGLRLKLGLLCRGEQKL